MSEDRPSERERTPPSASGGDADRHSSAIPSPERATAALREIAELVDEQIPAGYRNAAFRALARWQLQRGGVPTGVAAPSAGPAGSAMRDASRLERESVVKPGRLDLSLFASILGGSGRMLQKSLVALEVSRSQLGIDWLTPAEIERFLIERGRVRTAYRTNISNALSGARHLVDRRRRGRGYEYRITAPGRELLEREVRLGADL